MGKRKTASDGNLSKEDRDKLRAKLFTKARSSKESLATTLHILHQQGLLKDDELGAGASSREEKDKIVSAIQDHSNQTTPYGLVVQYMQCTNNDGTLIPLPYIHPCALLWYLSKLSREYSDLLVSMTRQQQPVDIIIYCDEFTPGNPLRPDSGRKCLGIYWLIMNMPGHLLSRDELWLPFGYVRHNVVNELRGGSSFLKAKCIDIFFGTGSVSFTSGIMIKKWTWNEVEWVAGESHIITGKFEGNLADESQHKFDYDLTGASGTIPCIECSNCMAGRDVSASGFFVNIDCTDRHQFRTRTDDDIYSLVDRITASNATDTRGRFKEMQQFAGINYSPNGLLWARHLRSILRPVTHYIRDWQHTLVSHGVATREVGELCDVLKKEGFSMDGIKHRIVSNFTLPKSLGRIDERWFSKKIIDVDTVKLYSSQVIQVVELLYCYLLLEVKPTGKLPGHIRCFECLHNLLQILRKTGREVTQEVFNTMESLIDEHAVLYRNLYHWDTGSEITQIKFHHLMHLAKDRHVYSNHIYIYIYVCMNMYIC